MTQSFNFLRRSANNVPLAEAEEPAERQDTPPFDLLLARSESEDDLPLAEVEEPVTRPDTPVFDKLLFARSENDLHLAEARQDTPPVDFLLPLSEDDLPLAEAEAPAERQDTPPFDSLLARSESEDDLHLAEAPQDPPPVHSAPLPEGVQVAHPVGYLQPQYLNPLTGTLETGAPAFFFWLEDGTFLGMPYSSFHPGPAQLATATAYYWDSNTNTMYAMPPLPVPKPQPQPQPQPRTLPLPFSHLDDDPESSPLCTIAAYAAPEWATRTELCTPEVEVFDTTLIPVVLLPYREELHTPPQPALPASPGMDEDIGYEDEDLMANEESFDSYEPVEEEWEASEMEDMEE